VSSGKVATQRVHTGDRVADDAQRAALDTARAWNRFPLAGAVLIDAEVGQPDGTGLAFTSGVTRSIAHGLGRKAIGFFEVYGAGTPSAAVVGLRAAAAGAGAPITTHVTVTPTSTGTCFLVVF
jgi:hypothetical protein